MTDEAAYTETGVARYRDKEWLRREYVEKDRTLADIAEMFDVSKSTISTWVRRHHLSPRQQNYDLSDVDIPAVEPWKDKEVLETLYVDKGLSTNEIAGLFECASNTVRKRLDEFDIGVRSQSEAAATAHNNQSAASYSIRPSGRAAWKSVEDQVFVYRLLAVAEYGFDAVCDKEVHHKNGIKWDDRPDNIELLDHDEHMGKHRKIDGLPRLRIAELYENGDCSSYTVADIVDVDVSPNSVIRIHREFYGGKA